MRDMRGTGADGGGKQMTDRIIGIDPGINGGVAVISGLAPGKVVSVLSLSDLAEAEVAAWFHQKSFLLPAGTPCFIEKVGYIKGDGGQGAFTFGKVYGLLRGLALANYWAIRDVYPAVWQSRLGCLTGGNKNVSKKKAIETFPLFNAGQEYGITHSIADALLIAEYGRRFIERETAYRRGA
jgi:hypothetical protein